MAVVGAYAHIDPSQGAELPARLGAIEGVSTFALGDPGKIGLLIEAESLERAHGLLRGEIPKTEGIRGVFPVYAHAEPEEDRESISS